MKKFTKIMLKVAATVACLGAICMVIAFALGLTTDGLKQMARDGKFTFDMTDLLVIKRAEIETKEELQIITDEEADVESDEWHYYLGKECDSLDVEFGAGLLDISYDDVEEIQIQHKNISGLKAEVKNGVLKIRSELEVSIDDVDDRSLVIIIPKDKIFNEIDLEVGASQADIKGLQAKEISITIGAGQANISDIVTGQFEMEVGAGQANVMNLSVDNLNVEAGLGEVNIQLNGVQDEYNYNVECGMGNVVVGDYSYGGLGAEHHTQNHHATKVIDVECGMGQVVIKFNE